MHSNFWIGSCSFRHQLIGQGFCTATPFAVFLDIHSHLTVRCRDRLVVRFFMAIHTGLVVLGSGRENVHLYIHASTVLVSALFSEIRQSQWIPIPFNYIYYMRCFQSCQLKYRSKWQPGNHFLIVCKCAP